MSSKMDFVLDATGRVGKEPESQYTPTGKMVTKTSLAVDVGSGDYKHTEWLALTVWGEKSGELFKSLVKKGTLLRVAGTPKINIWTGRDEKTNAQFEVNVDSFRVMKNGRSKEEDQGVAQPSEEDILY